MKVALSVFNPSGYPRSGNVSIPWDILTEHSSLEPTDIVVRSDSGVRLLSQLDPLDTDSPMPPRLHFSLEEEIESKTEATVTIENISQSSQLPFGKRNIILTQEIVWGYEGKALGARLSNEHLIVWLSLIPNPDKFEDDWYAGALTSVQLDGKELLDPFRAELGPYGHDKEKRSMQIDNLTIGSQQKTSLSDKQYELISHSIGPVRATVTIASPTIDTNNGTSPCRLYREINLYPKKTHILENLVVRQYKNREPLDFAVSYYSFMNLGHSPTTQTEEEQNYFAVGTPNFSPHPSFGFTSNRKVIPTDFDSVSKGVIKWSISADAGVARCLHYYMRGKRDVQFDERLWSRWHEFMEHPLNASIKGTVS